MRVPLGVVLCDNGRGAFVLCFLSKVLRFVVVVVVVVIVVVIVALLLLC